MEHKFTTLKIENFRGISKYETNLFSGYNEICGENGVGKTTILSAITWVLFGKSIDDRKQFSITPIINNEVKTKLKTTVELTIDNSFVVSRSWDNVATEIKCGFKDSTGKTNLTKCTQTEFKKFLEEHFVDEDTFKSLSNTNYLPSLNWKDLKEFIFKLIGEIKDTDVIACKSFPNIEEFIINMGSDKISSHIKEHKRINNEEIKRLETELNYAQQMKFKYVNDNKEQSEMIARKKELEIKIEDYYKLKQVEEDKRNKLSQNQKDTELSKRELQTIEQECVFSTHNINQLEELYKYNSFDVERQREEDIRQVKEKVFDATMLRNNANSNISSLETKLEELRKEGNKEKQREVKIINDKCDSCGQELPDEAKAILLDKLKKEQISNLTLIKKQYEDVKSNIKEQQDVFNKATKDIEEYNQQIKEIKEKIYDAVDETPKQIEIREKLEKEKKFFDEKVSKKKEVIKRIEQLEEEFKNLPMPEDIGAIYVLQAELKEINERLATTVTLENLNKDIEDKENELADANDAKEMIFKQEQELIEFNDVKAELLKSRIRQHFELVEFITKETNKQGDLVETFDLSYKGVKYSELNSAMKIKVALDLVNGVSKIKDINVPILIDSVEVVTTLPKYDRQMIVTRSMKQDIPQLVIKGDE